MIAKLKVNHCLSHCATSFVFICGGAMLCASVRGQTSGHTFVAVANPEKGQIATDSAEPGKKAARDELDTKPWYSRLKAPTPDEVEKYFNDLQQKMFAQQRQAEPREGKWPSFQPGPGGKDRWEGSGGGIWTLDPWGRKIFIEIPGKIPAPIVPLKPYSQPTFVPID